MSDTENAPREAEESEAGEERAGYDDAEPVSPDENPGDASKDLNEEAAAAYAEAGQTGSEEENDSSSSD